ncbi:hypothetical protein FRX31_019521 [Thalictrum thalictroides]|uniref:Uncharacterized protein n=1 Tax=Thalictrum thalictroides TaxID=46969 RepID=A0A7J6W1C0_THATH|nr:hypothetical protein FRX31_019521 [Thalictrum thalictroides]
MDCTVLMHRYYPDRSVYNGRCRIGCFFLIQKCLSFGGLVDAKSATDVFHEFHNHKGMGVLRRATEFRTKMQVLESFNGRCRIGCFFLIQKCLSFGGVNAKSATDVFHE